MISNGKPETHSSRLAERLASARARCFVGRTPELNLFRQILSAAHPPIAVLHVYGPGGVGKSTLLREYARLATEAGVRVIRLDGRTLDPSPGGFLLNIGAELGLAPTEPVIGVLTQLSRFVLVIDTYEVIAHLDTWLREWFLPQLPAAGLVVIAGRNGPTATWRAELEWRDLVRIISLRNLQPEESIRFLQNRGIPDEQHPPILSFTHGHPLALSLVTEVLEQSSSPVSFVPENQPDIIRALVERFMQQVPSPVHRRALELCAHARMTAEHLLSEVLELEDAHAIFDWLCSLSFIEQGPQGIFPHDLAREVIDADLRWRNPESYRQMHARIREFIVRGIMQSQGMEQQRRCFDLIYMHRKSPVMSQYIDWASLGEVSAEPATVEDYPVVLDIIGRFEGEESVSIARYWLQRQPESFIVFRGRDKQCQGFLVALSFTGYPEPEDQAADPAIRNICGYLRAYGPVRPDERVSIYRFWSGHQTYQVASGAHNMVAAVSIIHWLTPPWYAWSVMCGRSDGEEYWTPMFRYIGFNRASEADFQTDNHRYMIWGHDWRVEPLPVWQEIMTEREMATHIRPEMMPAQPSEPVMALSQQAFAEAVRDALRDFHRPAELSRNPLMQCRLVRDRADGSQSYTVLQTLLREALELLARNPRDEKLYRAVYRTYIKASLTQELAAELLDLPFSTYRYHLANGIKRVSDWLWQRELYGIDG
jgi:energy-coupling factor transporter ATP-binding protein EcfA2